MSARPQDPNGRKERRPQASPLPSGAESADPAPHGWTFLSNHAHVLICLREDSELRLRDLAARIGITERAVQKILAQLEHEGLLARNRAGRRNTYTLRLDVPLRHPIESHRSVRELVDLLHKGR